MFKRMRLTLCLSLLVLAAVLLAACGSSNSSSNNTTRSAPKTITPVSDLVQLHACLERHGLVLPKKGSTDLLKNLSLQHLQAIYKECKANPASTPASSLPVIPAHPVKPNSQGITAIQQFEACMSQAGVKLPRSSSVSNATFQKAEALCRSKLSSLATK